METWFYDGAGLEIVNIVEDGAGLGGSVCRQRTEFALLPWLFAWGGGCWGSAEEAPRDQVKNRIRALNS